MYLKTNDDEILYLEKTEVDDVYGGEEEEAFTYVVMGYAPTLTYRNKPR